MQDKSEFIRFEDRASGHPFVEKVWRCHSERADSFLSGGKTVLPPTEVPGGPKLAMFADPAGNITGLLKGK